MAKMTKAQKKVGKVMREFKSGTLHSGKKGPVVKSPKQAIAIALSEAGMSKPKKMAAGGVVSKGQLKSDLQSLPVSSYEASVALTKAKYGA
jgi:hypothetical protein